MRVRLWSGVVLSVVGSVLCCWNMSFNAIALPLKATFNLTQSQVELVSSISNAAVIFLIAEPLISAKFGYTFIYTLAWVISPLSGCLLYLAACHRSFVSERIWIIIVFPFLTSLFSNCMYMLLINIGINNFAKEHTGKVIGLYTGATAVGKCFYASLIEFVFEFDLADFFLTISIIWALVFGACVFCHRRRDITDPDLVPGVELTEPLEEKETVNHEENESIPVRDMFRSPHFHLIFWSFTFMHGSMFAYMNNLTSIGASVGMEEPTYLVYTLSVTLLVCRVLSGLLFDKLKTPVSRFALVILCHLAFIIALITLLVEFTAVVLYAVTVLIGVGMITASTLPLTMLVCRFGRQNYSTIYGCMAIFSPLAIISYQTAIGIIYDSEAIHQSSDNFCAGQSCFSLTFFVFLISGVISSILHVINFCLEKSLIN